MRKQTKFEALEELIDTVLGVQTVMPSPVQEKLREAIAKIEDAQDVLEGLEDGS